MEPDYTDLTEAKVIIMTKITNVKLSVNPNDQKQITISVSKADDEFADPKEKVLFFEDYEMVAYVKKQIEDLTIKAEKKRAEFVIKYLESYEIQH